MFGSLWAAGLSAQEMADFVLSWESSRSAMVAPPALRAPRRCAASRGNEVEAGRRPSTSASAVFARVTRSCSRRLSTHRPWADRVLRHRHDAGGADRALGAHNDRAAGLHRVGRGARSPVRRRRPHRAAAHPARGRARALRSRLRSSTSCSPRGFSRMTSPVGRSSRWASCVRAANCSRPTTSSSPVAPSAGRCPDYHRRRRSAPVPRRVALRPVHRPQQLAGADPNRLRAHHSRTGADAADTWARLGLVDEGPGRRCLVEEHR